MCDNNVCGKGAFVDDLSLFYTKIGHISYIYVLYLHCINNTYTFEMCIHT